MEAICKQMLLGTANAPLPVGSLENEPVVLVDRAGNLPPESRLLLSAGACAVYALAGRKTDSLDSVPEPAPQSDLPVPGPRGGQLLRQLFEVEHRSLLPEALRCLKAAGMRLPDELLPAALAMTDRAARAAVSDVLGARGLWLSQFSPEFAWVRGAVQVSVQGPDEDLDELWASGIIAEREALLRRLRSQEPSRGRRLLESTWAGEKAESRARLLTALTAGLTGEDQEFLETALKDRSESVRSRAAELLVHIDGSPLLQRVCARAGGWLRYTPAAAPKGLGSRLKSLVSRAHTGELAIHPPEQVDPSWEKEGTIGKPPGGVGPRAWCLARTLRLIPPAFWEGRLGASPSELLAAQMEEEWAAALVTGWTQAALLHQAHAWMPALYDFLISPAAAKVNAGLLDLDAATAIGELLAGMEPAASSPRVRALIETGAILPFPWPHGLDSLSTPWTPEVGRVYLAHMRGIARKAPWSAGVEGTVARTLALAARALPPECFDDALAAWNLPDSEEYHVQLWRTELGRFTETISMRQRFVKEFTKSEVASD